LLTSVGFMLNETPPADWVRAPRFHHQFLPDVVQYEPGAFSDAVAAELTQRGHHLKPMKRRYGNMQAILLDRYSGHVTGITDPRGEGAAVATR